MGKFNMAVGLTKKQLSFLDNMSRSCENLRGKRLARSMIIRALLSVAKELKIDVAGVKTEKQLRNRFIEAFHKGGCKE